MNFICLNSNRNELADVLELLKTKIQPAVTDEERHDGTSGSPGDEKSCRGNKTSRDTPCSPYLLNNYDPVWV